MHPSPTPFRAPAAGEVAHQTVVGSEDLHIPVPLVFSDPPVSLVCGHSGIQPHVQHGQILDSVWMQQIRWLQDQNACLDETFSAIIGIRQEDARRRDTERFFDRLLLRIQSRHDIDDVSHAQHSHEDQGAASDGQFPLHIHDPTSRLSGAGAAYGRRRG